MEEPSAGSSCFTCGSKAVTMRERRVPRLLFCGTECHGVLYDSCVRGMLEIGKEGLEQAEHALVGDYIDDMSAEDLEPIMLRLPPRALLVMAKASVRAQLFTSDPKFRLRYMRANRILMRGIMRSLCLKPDIMLDWMPQMLENNLWNITTNGAKIGSADYDFLQAASYHGRVQVVKYLLADGRLDPGADGNRCLTSACEGGSVEVVKLLLTEPRVHPEDPQCTALEYAIDKGHTQIVLMLLVDRRLDPAANTWNGVNTYLMNAAVGRFTEILALLLQDGRANPALSQNQLFILAVANGSAAVVSILLADRRVTPLTDGLKVAVNNQALDIIDLLLTDGRVDAVEGWKHMRIRWLVTPGRYKPEFNMAIEKRFLEDKRIQALLHVRNVKFLNERLI